MAPCLSLCPCPSVGFCACRGGAGRTLLSGATGNPDESWILPVPLLLNIHVLVGQGPPRAWGLQQGGGAGPLCGLGSTTSLGDEGAMGLGSSQTPTPETLKPPLSVPADVCSWSRGLGCHSAWKLVSWGKRKGEQGAVPSPGRLPSGGPTLEEDPDLGLDPSVVPGPTKLKVCDNNAKILLSCVFPSHKCALEFSRLCLTQYRRD